MNDDEIRQPLLKPNDVGVSPHYASINPSEIGPETNGEYASIGVYKAPPPKGGDHSIQTDSEVEIHSELKMKLYKRRWYILLIYSLFAGTQGGVWNTWGPISASCEEAFDWHDADISLLTNWGPISYIVSAVFFSWMIDVKGLRWACLSSMLLVAVGCGLRCITSTPPAVTWLSNAGQMFNGLAGPVAMGGPPVVSAVWFASHERVTSTAIAFAIPAGMTALSFVLGPLLVPDKTNPNCTKGNLTFDLYRDDLEQYSYNFEGMDLFQTNNCSNASKAARIAEERKDIMFLMYIEFGWSLAILLAMLLYFPKKPPLPPCITASLRRESFLTGLKQLMTKGQFWLVCFVYGLAIGVLNCWVGVLDLDLKSHKIGQKEAGWIGFYATCSGCAASLVMARFADVFSKHMKWIVLVMYTIGGGFFTWFTLVCLGTAPFSTVVLYVTVIAGITSLNSSVPLLFELSCELTYPIGEGTTNGVLTLINNIGGLVFLLILMIPNIETMWMNWALLGSIGACLPVLLLLKDTYKRLELDERRPSTLES